MTNDQAKVYLVTFLCIVAAHSSREGWWMVKGEIHTTQGYSSIQLGIMDSTFLFLYSMGYFASGVLADKYSPSTVLTASMLASMGAFCGISFLGLASVKSFWLFLCLWAVEGIAQGCILTIAVGIVANWFLESRAQVLGFWGANASLGNIVGEWVAAILHEDLGFDWEWVVMITSCFMGVMGLCVHFLVSDYPPKAFSSEDSLLLKDQIKKPCKVGFWESWLLPGVACCAISYSGAKLLNYGFFMWLPYYLQTHYKMGLNKVGVLTSLYDLGGIAGSVLGGHLCQLTFLRSGVVGLFLGLAVPFVVFFQYVGLEEAWMFFLIVPATGFMIGGSCNLISTVVAADLSRGESSQPKTTVIGIINGSGSLGAALGQGVIGSLQSVSWSAVFCFMVIVNLVTALSTLPNVISESKKKYPFS